MKIKKAGAMTVMNFSSFAVRVVVVSVRIKRQGNVLWASDF